MNPDALLRMAIRGLIRAIVGVSAPATPRDAAPLPSTITPERRKNIANDAPLFERAARDLGLPAIVGTFANAVAWHETRDGRGWGVGSPLEGCHNAGSVQCADVNGTDCVARDDRRADGSTYAVGFKCYPNEYAGFFDVVKHLKNRPRTVSGVTEPGATVFRACYALRRERYYEGFCFAVAAEAPEAARASFTAPERDSMTLACQKEAVEGYAKVIFDALGLIALATGQPRRALALGSYGEARAWYTKRWPS